jgi:hypothetical protein
VLLFHRNSVPYHSCSRHCATNREIPVSIRGRILGNFQVTELISAGVQSISDRNLYQVIFLRPARRADKFRPICTECRNKDGRPTFRPPFEFMTCDGKALLYSLSLSLSLSLALSLCYNFSLLHNVHVYVAATCCRFIAYVSS